MVDDMERSRAARQAAEAALVRVVHHYGSRPEFVVLGGLVPELLCSTSEFRHAGTTDIDVHSNHAGAGSIAPCRSGEGRLEEVVWGRMNLTFECLGV